MESDTKRKTNSNASKTWLVALPVIVALSFFGLWTFTRGAKPSRKRVPVAGASSTASSSALAKIAVQEGDLPKGFRKCSFSGDFLVHNEKLKANRQDAYQSNLILWKRLQAQGATQAYVAYWGDTPEACNNVVSDEQGMAPHMAGQTHPSLAWSLVVAFTSPETAASAYKADIFEQSALKTRTDFEVKDGEASGLGPNAISAIQPKAAIPVEDAIWQNHAMMVRFGSENLTITQSEGVTEAVNGRIP